MACEGDSPARVVVELSSGSEDEELQRARPQTGRRRALDSSSEEDLPPSVEAPVGPGTPEARAASPPGSERGGAASRSGGSDPNRLSVSGGGGGAQSARPQGGGAHAVDSSSNDVPGVEAVAPEHRWGSLPQGSACDPGLASLHATLFGGAERGESSMQGSVSCGGALSPYAYTPARVGSKRPPDCPQDPPSRVRLRAAALTEGGPEALALSLADCREVHASLTARERAGPAALNAVETLLAKREGGGEARGGASSSGDKPPEEDVTLRRGWRSPAARPAASGPPIPR